MHDMNPYAPPGQASSVEDPHGAQRATKPWRIWILQALVAVQLVTLVVATVSVLRSPEVQELPFSTLFWGLLRPLVAAPCITALLLSLQRLGPKPSLVAPTLASLWWVVSVVTLVLQGANSDDPTSDDAASSSAPWIGVAIAHLFLLWLVASTWLHGKTRAYLEQKA